MLVRDIKLANRLGFKVGRTKLAVIDEILTPAILKVKKEGGLPLGMHDVEIIIVYSRSYLPPRINLGFGAGEDIKRRLTLLRQGFFKKSGESVNFL